MKQLFPLILAVAVGALAWCLRGRSDATILEAKSAANTALLDIVHGKDKQLSQDDGLIGTRDESIKALQEKIKSDEDLLAKNKAQLDADKAAYDVLKNSDQTLMNSMKGDSQAQIDTLKSQIQDKDGQMAQLNERLAQTIANYEHQLSAWRTSAVAATDDSDKIYPKDNGFEAHDMGSGFNAYQVFGPVTNPLKAPLPDSVPNRSPWSFGGGNAGIAANGCGMLIANAKNGDSDGKTSQSGQAAFLQFKGGWFSQKIRLTAGTYRVSFDYEARQDYGEANGIAVSLDGTDLFVGAPNDPNNFVRVTTDTLTLTKATMCELKFRGLGALTDPTGDHTTFIDNICINIVGSHKHSGKTLADGINPAK